MTLLQKGKIHRGDTKDAENYKRRNLRIHLPFAVKSCLKRGKRIDTKVQKTRKHTQKGREMTDEPFIKLDQFLKREALASSGGEAKQLIQAGLVKVNGQVETRRGRKLREGDRVQVEDDDALVVADLRER